MNRKLQKKKKKIEKTNAALSSTENGNCAHRIYI